MLAGFVSYAALVGYPGMGACMGIVTDLYFNCFILGITASHALIRSIYVLV